MKTERIELYKAAKYEATTYKADHGMNTAEMWAAVNDPADTFWRRECLEDYRKEVLMA